MSLGNDEKNNARREEARTHFGFSSVAADEKASLVRDVFDSVAPKYDLMNDLMSLGIHRLWKRALMDWLGPRPEMKLIDVGGGTGDLAFRFLKRGGAQVTVCDINREMLAVGRDRALDRGIVQAIEWKEGDAEDLPVDDESYDAYITAFCLRNVTRIDAALREARRVLKPGGRFICLEFSRLTVPALESLYDAYSFKVLPVLGEIVAGDRGAYDYLVQSIRRFPGPEAFAAMIGGSGLGQVKVRRLSGGIAALHSAWRI